MAGPADYCTADDLQVRQPNASEVDEAPNWSDYIHAMSRGIDRFCNRPGGFAPDPISGVKYFDVPGDPSSGTAIRQLQLQYHDFYGAVVIKVAQRENGDPATPADWVTLAGDGITPPSDFFLGPDNPSYLGKFGSALLQPWYRIDIPANPPQASTTYQSSLLPGKRTLSINPTGWGWPAVPDEIRNICIRGVIRMAAGSGAGETGQVGSPEYGAATIQKYLDFNDIMTLSGYKKFDAG